MASEEGDMPKRTGAWTGLLLLGSLVACGGGGGGGSSSAPSATTLGFTTTATTSEYRFVKDTALSTDTRLVLDLLGPMGVPARGVAIFLAADTSKVTWVNPATGSTSGSLIQTGSQFTVGPSPTLVADKVSGAALQAGVFQKGGTAATYDGTPILSVALALNSGAATGTVTFGATSSGQSIALSGASPGLVTNITIDYGRVTVE
jgi:hypothetical protein